MYTAATTEYSDRMDIAIVEEADKVWSAKLWKYAWFVSDSDRRESNATSVDLQTCTKSSPAATLATQAATL